MEKRAALVETGKARMRPILMTSFTTVLAMSVMAVSHSQGAEMGRGMAIVTIGGLLYATLMTLFIVPVMYDIIYRKKDLKAVDLGDESTLNITEEDEERLLLSGDDSDADDAASDVGAGNAEKAASSDAGATTLGGRRSPLRGMQRGRRNRNRS